MKMKKLLAVILSVYACSATAAVIEFVPPNDPTGQVFTINTNDGWAGGRGVVFQATANNTIDSIGVYHDLTGIDLSYKLSQTTGASGDVEAGETVLASGNATISNNGLEWNDFALSDIPLAAGNYYHIEFSFSGNGNQNFFYNNANVAFTQGDFELIDGTSGGSTSNFVMPAIRLNTTGDSGPGINTHTFAVSLDVPAGVVAPATEVSINCNAGIPLQQTASVGTTFSVTELSDGAICRVSLAEDLPPGYMITQYDYGPAGSENTSGDEECFFNISSGVATDWGCIMTLAVGEFSYDVTVAWDLSETGDPSIGAGTEVELECQNVWDDDTSSLINVSTSGSAEPGASMPVSLGGYAPDPNGTTTCNAYLTNAPEFVESDPMECDVSVQVGDTEAACTINALVFFEGIPVINRYGMAMMVLLMLGLGMVGLRRFI